MAFKTLLISDREYTSLETANYIQNFQTFKEVFARSFIHKYKYFAKVDYKLPIQDNYSGVEIVNFLNDLSSLNVFSSTYHVLKAKIINKLVLHEYSKKTCVTLDDIPWWCPQQFNNYGAVLNIFAKDLPEQNNVKFNHPSEKNLVDEMKNSDEL